MFDSEKRMQEKQHKDNMEANAESNDMNFISEMNKMQPAYDPQVSGMLLEVQRRFLKWRVVKAKSPNGEDVFQMQCVEKYNYKEPYSDEALSFMEEDEERRLLNVFGSTLAQVKTFADKYDLDWHLPFNNITNIRENFLLNSRTTGRPGKLAKSQFTETNAQINRQLMPQKKKGGFLGGLLG